MAIFDPPQADGFSIFDWQRSLGAKGEEGVDASSPAGREITGDERERA
jgi:hypothetical protein